MEPALRLSLLGGFAVDAREGSGASIPGRKVRALLAFLAMHPGETQSRDRLATLLWEESADTQARHSLRQALATLRRSLPTGVLHTDGETVSLMPGSVAVDALVFQDLLGTGTPEALEQAVAIYRGEFLEGFNPRAGGFEDWLMARRGALREEALEAMASLLARYLEDATADEQRAVQLAHRLVGLDPLREAAHRTLMRLYARQHQYAAALRQYHACRAVLEKELGVPPEPETDDLYRQILARRRAPAPRNTPTPAPPTRAREMPPQHTPTPDAPPAETELRQATVLLARAAAAPDGSDGPDPEALHERLNRHLARVSAAAGRYGGSVVDHLGDTVMVIFGLPRAHGNDAERAVRAADAIHREAHDETSGTCIGIASGRLVSGPAPAHGGYAVTGAVVEQARELATAAAPGQTWLSESARRSVDARITVEATGPGAWRVRGVAPPWLPAPASALVGRRAELHQLHGALESCLETGHGQGFLIRGEAGIGKTRLLEEALKLAAGQGFECHRVLILDFGSGTGRGAVHALVRGLLGLPPAGEAETRAALARAARGSVEERMLLLDLLDLPPPAELAGLWDAMDGATREREARALVARLLTRASRRRPLLLVVEDIHWAEPFMMGCLSGLAAAARDCAALLVMSARVEGEPLESSWRATLQGASLSTIELGPLREEESLELARQLTGVGGELALRCARRAAGHPLFLEQLLRAGGGTEVPESVESLVWARLDHLAPGDRYAAQAASVLGQRFALAPLRHLIEDPDYRCDALLEQHLLRPDGEDFLFAHALVLAAVYGSLLRSRRRTLHRRAADWFAERDPVLHAEHLERGGEPGAPAAYLAASKAQARAYRQDSALALARRGLALDGDPSIRFELNHMVGKLLREAGDIHEAVATFREALERATEATQRCRAWLGIAAGLSVEDRHDDALAALDEAARWAEAAPRPDLMARIHYSRGNTLFPLGRIRECLAEHRCALVHARKAGMPELEARALSGLGDAWYQRGRILSAHDQFQRCVSLCQAHGLGRIEVANRAMLAMTRFYRNEVQAALEELRATAEFAAAVGHRRAQMLAHDIAGTVLTYRGDMDGVARESEQGLDLARRLGARRFEADNLAALGHALATRGEPDRAWKLLEQALAISRDIGTSYSTAWILGLMALVSADPERRERCLARGEAYLDASAVSHNHLHFRQLAMEVCLGTGDWARLEHHAAGLEAYTRAEPLPWSRFFIARGRALARWGAAERSEALVAELRRLAAEAQAAGLGMALPALRQALAQV